MPHRTSQRNLTLYLEDHLAGSVAAIRALRHVRRVSDDEDVVRRMSEVREAVEEDRQMLDGLRRRLGISRSRPREAAATAFQALSDLKLRLHPSKRGQLQLLQTLDALTMGIAGKRSLWVALAAAADADPRLRSLDYTALIERADEQIAELHRLHAATARRAFSPGGD